MARHGFEIECEIAAPIGSVRAWLRDLDRLSRFHPLIESIDALPSRLDRPRARFWRVVDRIPFGPLRFRTTYIAAIEEISEFEIVGEAWQRPRIELRTLYSLAALKPLPSLSSLGDLGSGERTLVLERVEIRAPLGLGHIVTTQARRAHAVLLERLRERLENPSPDDDGN